MEKIIDIIDKAIKRKGYKSIILEGKNFDVAAFYKDNIPGEAVYGIITDSEGLTSGIIENYNGTYIMLLSDKGHYDQNDYNDEMLEALMIGTMKDYKTDTYGNIIPEEIIERYATSSSLTPRPIIDLNRRIAINT